MSWPQPERCTEDAGRDGDGGVRARKHAEILWTNTAPTGYTAQCGRSRTERGRLRLGGPGARIVGRHGDPEKLAVVPANTTAPRTLAQYDGDAFAMNMATLLAGANAAHHGRGVWLRGVRPVRVDSLRLDMADGKGGVFQRTVTARTHTPSQDCPRIAMRFGHDAQREARSTRVYED